MTRFVDLADGGRQLAPLVAPLLSEATVVVSMGAGGVVTGAAVAEALGITVTPLVATRTDDGVAVEVTLDVDGLDVVVVDDGVETGTAAMVAGAAIREAGAVGLVLAVPVCPREVEAGLASRFDAVVAVTRPLARRSLRWHYDTFA